jgi:hypothetical protein
MIEILIEHGIIGKAGNGGGDGSIDESKGKIIPAIFTGITDPIVIKKGDIWVKTSENVSKIGFYNSEPPHIENMVWIKPADLDVVIDATKALPFMQDNRIDVTMKYQIQSRGLVTKDKIDLWRDSYLIARANLNQAKIYKSGKWVNIEAYYWDSEQWISFSYVGREKSFYVTPYTSAGDNNYNRIIKTTNKFIDELPIEVQNLDLPVLPENLLEYYTIFKDSEDMTYITSYDSPLIYKETCFETKNKSKSNRYKLVPKYKYQDIWELQDSSEATTLNQLDKDIKIISSNYTILTSIGKSFYKPPFPPFFTDTAGICEIFTDGMGNIYVSNSKGNVTKVNHRGEKLWTINTDSVIRYLVIDRDENVYYSDIHGYVHKLNYEGKKLFSLKQPKESIYVDDKIKLAVDVKGNLYCTNYQHMRKYNSSGELIFQVDAGSSKSNISDMVIDKENEHIYCSNNSKELYQLRCIDGKRTAFRRLVNYTIRTLKIDKYNNIYILCGDYFVKYVVYENSSEFHRLCGEEIRHVLMIVVDKDGIVYTKATNSQKGGYNYSELLPGTTEFVNKSYMKESLYNIVPAPGSIGTFPELYE